MMGAEIIHNDDVTGMQGWDKAILQKFQESIAGGSAFIGDRNRTPVQSHRGKDGCCYGRIQRCVVYAACSFKRSSIEARHIRVDPALIQEYETIRRHFWQFLQPLFPFRRHIGDAHARLRVYFSFCVGNQP